MPISINGSGTITGISVGGLPDGIVDDGREFVGFIAQDVQKVADYLIKNTTGDIDVSKTDLLAMSQTNLIPLLVNSVKKFNAENEEISQKIQNQEEQIEELSARIEELES
tara:strand:+ start:961 stop:1290 length:330 start_codon:yes stop_codon:yes gene_type:complete